MTLTHKIYEDLLASTESEKKQISQRYDIAKQYMIYSASKRKKVRHLFFKVSLEDAKAMPRCNGIDIEVVQLPEYEVEAEYCDLAQVQGSEPYIYEAIIEDIRVRAVDKPNLDIASIASLTLRKWKDFFSKNREIILSSERQQGLYGELRVLEELLDSFGIKAINYWTGCYYETHDFYDGRNAIEVKTTSIKAPYKMHISSEYQLDAGEVKGKLFVRFFAFRKSDADGERLPEIINRIRDKMQDNPHALSKFNSSLEEYGYFDVVAEYYTTGYTDRENALLEVKDDFPKIVPNDLNKGISNCTYDILVDQCAKYVCEFDYLLHAMEGVNTND